MVLGGDNAEATRWLDKRKVREARLRRAGVDRYEARAYALTLQEWRAERAERDKPPTG